jgi:hypothetical protein
LKNNHRKFDRTLAERAAGKPVNSPVTLIEIKSPFPFFTTEPQNPTLCHIAHVACLKHGKTDVLETYNAIQAFRAKKNSSKCVIRV